MVLLCAWFSADFPALRPTLASRLQMIFADKAATET
jgi:hypothetical protein